MSSVSGTGPGSGDSSYEAWAGQTMAAAEAHQQAANDAAWDSRTDDVVDPPKTAAERAQDAFWANDPNRPPPPPPTTQTPAGGDGTDGGPDNGTGGAGGSEGTGGSGGGSEVDAGSTGGSDAPGRVSSGNGTPNKQGSEWVRVDPEDAKQMIEAGGYQVRQTPDGHWEVNSGSVDKVDVTVQAPALPAPDYNPGTQETPPPGQTGNGGQPPPAEQQPVPQEPGLNSPLIEPDDLIPGAGVVKRLILKGGKWIAEKLAKEGLETVAEKTAAKVGKEAGKEAAEAAAKAGEKAGAKEGAQALGNKAPTGPGGSPPTNAAGGAGRAAPAAGAGSLTRPDGVPAHWVEKPSRTGGGVRYVDPANPHNSVRVMPGDPNSPYPNSQQPYVRHIKDGQSLDVNGNPVPKNTPEAHIPLTDWKWPF